MMMTILVFVLCLSVLVFVHELGHFAAARWRGVAVSEFSIGFPPKAWGKKVGNTEYMVSWIPLGGYVRLKGLDTEDDDPEADDSYLSKDAWERFVILAAGPTMNLILACILMPLVFAWGIERPLSMQEPARIWSVEADSPAAKAGLVKGDLIVSLGEAQIKDFAELNEQLMLHSGQQVKLLVHRNGNDLIMEMDLSHLLSQGAPGWLHWTSPVAGAITPGSPAAEAGLQEGDLIQEINGVTVESWHAIPEILQMTQGAEVSLRVLRAGQSLTLQARPRFHEEGGRWILGFNLPQVRVMMPLPEAIDAGLSQVFQLSVKTFDFVFRLVSGKANSEQLGGPIMIAQVMGQAAEKGATDLLFLMSFISLQLGLLNLLPIPALDGGHILLLAVERVKGSALSKTLVERINRVGMTFLMILIIFVSIQDGLRLFK